MKCPKCQAENREGIKFCEECGARMELVCPGCGMKIPLGKNFCGECGNPLSPPSKPAPKELSFKEKFSQIQEYLPQGLTDKILAQRGRIEGERRQVTVMFCDMEGYTPLTEKLGEEEAYALMDQVYEILIHKVHDYEGTVNEMTGDGIIALFGAPIALEDAPQRAIRSALAIHREITRFSDRMMQEKGIPIIKMRAGIHTGPVVVGTLGNDLRVEFKAVGDTVNLASRMEGLAEPGTTYVTEDTFKLTEGFFRFEALGEKTVKGKDTPVRIYQVIAPSTRRTRFDVSAERGLTPFVGRARELELLLDGLERSKGGRGQAFSIVAEAGVGKSRLLYEFRKSVTNEDVNFLEGRCLSYGRGVAYHPIIDILKSNFEIREGEEDLKVRERVQKGLKVLKVDSGSTLPYILELLSIKDSGMEKLLMSPEGRKDRIIESLKQIVVKGSEIRPLIMAIEDLHWADRSTEEALKHILESIPGSRVLLIFTYRPEFVHTWGGKSYHNQITLNRLSNRESILVAANLLGGGEIDQEIEELILGKTEGVPFFIEEFIKSLKDLKIIRKEESKYRLAKGIQDFKIPSTIHDVIMARVDSLPSTAKELLQTGSVIEREFPYELIQKVTNLPERDLFAGFSVLKESELLYERGIFPQSTYIFKHALTREVVYDSLLAKKKKALHEAIANIIAGLHEETLEHYYEVLAEHFIASENYEKGAEYCRLASRKAEKIASFNDAISLAKRRVVCIEHLPQTEDVQLKRIDARTALAMYMEQLNHTIEAKEAIDPIIELAIKINYRKRLGHVYAILGCYNFLVKEDLSSAFRDFTEALKISEEIKNIFIFGFANYYLGGALAVDCKFEKGADHYQKAIDINVGARSPSGISVTKTTLAQACYFYWGKINLQFQTTAQALQVAEESGDIYSKGVAHSSHGTSFYAKGFLKEAENDLLKGVGFCERINWPSWNMWSHLILGEIYFENGEFLKSIEHYEMGIRVSKISGLFPFSWRSMGKVGVTRSKVRNNEKEIDLTPLYEYSRNIKFKIIEGLVSSYIGEILLNIDDQHMPEAENWIQKAIEADQRNGTRWYLGKDYALYSKLFNQKRDRFKAQESLGKAIEILKECGADGWVEKYEKELALIA